MHNWLGGFPDGGMVLNLVFFIGAVFISSLSWLSHSNFLHKKNLHRSAFIFLNSIDRHYTFFSQGVIHKVRTTYANLGENMLTLWLDYYMGA